MAKIRTFRCTTAYSRQIGFVSAISFKLLFYNERKIRFHNTGSKLCVTFGDFGFKRFVEVKSALFGYM